ncbi:MAG: cupin domain-containing protein [Desulfobacteraceae bacterium]|jgi:transcriptional regulator with XRE-family HTH domain
MQQNSTISDTEIQRDVDALCLGSKIRKLRKMRGLTLQEVSDLSGLSKSLLSQIENETSAPPIPTLVRIARSLGVTIGHFFKETDHRQRVSVVRKHSRQETAKLPHNRPRQSGYRYFSLAHPVIDQHMEPFWVRFESREESEGTFYQHSGEEFLYVYEGQLEFKSEGERILLMPGDSLYFKSDLPHAVRNLGDDPASAVAVIYTPRE